MSRIYFHSKNHDAIEIWGGERAWLGSLCGRMLVASLDLDRSVLADEQRAQFQAIIRPRDHYLLAESRDTNSHCWLNNFRTALRVSMSDIGLEIAGQEIDSFHLAMNAAIVTGSPPIQLAARIHGQCEVHGYFRPESWPWLARVVKRGLETGIYRKWIYSRCKACDSWKDREEQKRKRAACTVCDGTGRGEKQDIGWLGLLELLENEEPELLVMSYSVCDQFPPRHAIERHDESNPEWEDRYPTWDEGVEWLMSQGELTEALNICEENINEQFGADVSGWMLNWEEDGVVVG